MFRNARSRYGAAAGVVVAASFYRPVEHWTHNVWDVSTITGLLGVGVFVSLIGLAGLWYLQRAGADVLVAALGIGAILIVLVRWVSFPGISGVLLVFAIAIAMWLGNRHPDDDAGGWLALAFLTAFGLVPVVQLVTAMSTHSEPYAVIDLPSPRPATASDQVEDVVVLIVDTYPNPNIAEGWFGHDPTALSAILEGRGFDVASNPWSRHTFTALSVSSTLELTSVIEPGPTESWGNRSSLWSILRGDNFVSQTLESAGYVYAHYETGWSGSSCGPQVDRCVTGPWLDESMRLLLLPTVLHDWVAPHHFISTGTINAAAALSAQLPEITTNGTREYVFAHLLLPHPPILVDHECRRVDVASLAPKSPEYAAAFSEQLGCVDKLLVSITEHLDRDTAVLITADHGPNTNAQLSKPPGTWTDSDIAERFGILMTYKLPSGCSMDGSSDPMTTMAAILDCALVGSFSAPEPEYLIGAIDPVAVDARRMDEIKSLVAEDAASLLSS